MANDGWTPTTLDKEVDLLTGFPFKSSRYTDAPDGIKLIRGDNVVQGRFRWENVKRWPRSETDDLDRYQLEVGDVVLAMDRPWIEAGLKYAAIAEHHLPALLVQRVARLRGGPTLDTGYLRYLLGSPQFTQHILAVQTGTAVPHISGKQIKEFRFHRPPLPVQQRIADVLGKLDDKIELNRRMNRTLEKMAAAIFKSWFVDFDPVHAKAAPGNGRDPNLPAEIADLFPDTFEDSDLGPIPKGWDVKPLDEIADYLNGLACQKHPPVEGQKSLPVIKIRELRQGITNNTDRASVDVPPKYIVEDGDVLFSWSGSLLVSIWCEGRGVLNQHVFKVTSASFPKWYFYQATKHHLDEFQRIASDKATTMGHIKRHHLTDAKMAIPDAALMAKGTEVLGTMLDRRINALKQARNLGLTRDALLPKLLSGEIELPEAEAIAEEVA